MFSLLSSRRRVVAVVAVAAAVKVVLSFEVRDAAQERRQQLWQDLDSLEIDVSDLIATCQLRGFETRYL